MGWSNGLPISVGALTGQFIGFSDIGYGGSADFNIYSNQSGRYSLQTLDWINTEFNQQIDISEYFNPGHANFNTELAGVNIVDENKNVVARFVCRLDKTGNQWHLTNMLQDPLGNVIAFIMRSQGGNVTIPFDPTGSYSTGVWKVYLALSVTTNGNDRGIAWVINYSQCGSKYGNWFFGQYGVSGSGFHENELANTFGINGKLPEPKTKSPEFGPASEPGGYGPGSGGSGGSGGPGPTFDDTSDTWIPTPTKPGVLSYGLLNIYKADTGALLNLGRELFPSIPTFPAPVDPGQADLTTYLKYAADIAKWLTNSINALAESIWNKDLINFIVSCHLVPIDVTRGALEDIEVGARTLTGILAGRVTNDVIEFDCGTVHIDEFYTNYVDYMTSCRLYLPYYGMVTIKPEYWQSADISIKYLWNIVDGSFTAQVFSTITRHQSPCTTLIGQYSGNACVHMPLSGSNYATMFATLAGAAGGIAAGVATGNVKVAASSAMALAGSIGSAGDMQMSNAYNATSSFYSHSRPFLIIERPISHFSENYTQEKGIPLYVAKKLSACSGFTVVEDPILDFACPDDEAEAIRNALKTGVIL